VFGLSISLVDRESQAGQHDVVVRDFFTFGGFEPVLSKYYLNGYTSYQLNSWNHCETPLPTQSLGLILKDAAPATEEEEATGYPHIPVALFNQYGLCFTIFIEEVLEESDRKRYQLAKWDLYPGQDWKEKVTSQVSIGPARPSELTFEKTFQPENESQVPVGAKNMRFKFESTFWSEGSLVYFHVYKTLLDWRISTPRTI